MPLSDELCESLEIAIGDILRFLPIDSKGQIKIVKHDDQTMSDEEIENAGNLSRVVPLTVADTE